MPVEPPYPTHLELRGENALLIRWSDSTEREYTFRELRDACPCATCRESGRRRLLRPVYCQCSRPRKPDP